MSNQTLPQKHWSVVEYLHETVKNPNIHIRGRNSYYSNAWTGSISAIMCASGPRPSS
jgi:chloramphenicol O-acetyltransferase type B